MGLSSASETASDRQSPKHGAMAELSNAGSKLGRITPGCAGKPSSVRPRSMGRAQDPACTNPQGTSVVYSLTLFWDAIFPGKDYVSTVPGMLCLSALKAKGTLPVIYFTGNNLSNINPNNFSLPPKIPVRCQVLLVTFLNPEAAVRCCCSIAQPTQIRNTIND